MNIFKTLWAWFAVAWMPLYFDINQPQSSDASQTTSSENQDNRMVSEGGSTSIGLSRSSMNGVNITTTDHGAIDGAFQFGTATVGKSFDFVKAMAEGAANASAASASQVTAVTKSAMQSVQDAYKDTGDKIANAYTEAKAGEQKIMVAGALLIGAVVALKALGKGA